MNSKKKITGGVGFLIAEIDTKQSHSKISYTNSEKHLLAALSVQSHFNPWLFLEMNVSYGRFQFVRNHNTQIISEAVNRFHIPLVLRISPLPFFRFFSIGAGFYGSYRVGSVHSVQSTLSEVELTSAHDSGEHGIEGVAGFNIPTFLPNYQIGADFRTLFSLTERKGEARSWQSFLFVIRGAIPE